jgi:hypothetical protein
MTSTQIFGALVVCLAGFWMGANGWPIKIMKKFQYEHWGFINGLFGIVVFPWLITLLLCPSALAAYASVDKFILLKSNLWSLAWGIANILCVLCFVRIGFSLTGSIVTSLGAALGVTIPMVFKGSGLFQHSPGLGSPPGQVTLVGVALIVAAVFLAAKAGRGRSKILHATETVSNHFTVGILMAVIAGILFCGISFAFVYSQESVVAAMKAYGADDIPANCAVWAVGLLGAGAVNVLYPAWLMTRNRSWRILGENRKEMMLSLMMGAGLCATVALMGKGMLLMGALGASVGFGIQQAMLMTGMQAVGFIGGEWRGVRGAPRRQIYLAIALLVAAAAVMTYGNSLAGA